MNMYFTDRKKLLYENMSHFNQLPDFEKELEKLSKKYSSLYDDLNKFEKLLEVNATGIGKNFTIIHHAPKVKIVKARLACKSLRDRSIRIVYAFHGDSITFVYIEMYFKGDKDNEDRERIKEYLKNLK